MPSISAWSQGESVYYFAYASNLNKKQMQERLPDSQPKFTAILPNYKLVFVGWSRQWRGGVAGIKPFNGEKVRGATYEISDRDMKRLDSYEGCPGNYNRLNVTLFDEDNQPIPAVTYVKSGRVEETKPSTEYLAVVQQGYRDWRLF